MSSSKTAPAKPSSVPLQVAAPAACSVPGSSSDPAVSMSFLTSLFVSSSHHDPLTSCAMPKITSLLPVPGARSSTLICPETTATCPRHPAKRLVPKASISERAKCKPTHPATLSTTLFYPSFLQSGSCSFASFKGPSFSLTYLFHIAPLHSICSFLQTFVIFQEPAYPPQGCGFLLPLLWGHRFLPHLPSMLYCDTHPPKCKWTANLSGSRLQLQNRCTGWSTSQRGKMLGRCSGKHFSRQQEPKCTAGALESYFSSCYHAPKSASSHLNYMVQLAAGMVPRMTIISSFGYTGVSLASLYQFLPFDPWLLPQPSPDLSADSMHMHSTSTREIPSVHTAPTWLLGRFVTLVGMRDGDLLIVRVLLCNHSLDPRHVLSTAALGRKIKALLSPTVTF